MERLANPKTGAGAIVTDFIYSRPDRCGACGAELHPWLSGVRDRVYGVDGQWDLVRCGDSACAAAYLDARLTGEQLGSFYATYSTHSDPVLAASGAKRGFRQAVEWFLHRNLGYRRPEASAATSVLARFFCVVPFLRHMALSRVFWLPHVAEGKLVELGFGNAQTLLQMRDLGWDVEGIEFDTVCVDKARMLGLRVGEGDFRAQNYADGSLDAVVGSHVIEHVPGPGELIAAIHDKLAPGGRMVLITPNGKSLGCRFMGADWRGLETPRHLTVQTPGSLIRHARRAGFRTIKLFGTPLGGGILQQSVQIRRGKPAGPTGRIAQLFWAIIASTVHLVRADASDEIVLFCEK